MLARAYMRDAAAAAFVALMLALPLVGFRAVDEAQGLRIETRFDWVAIAVVAVFLGHPLEEAGRAERRDVAFGEARAGIGIGLALGIDVDRTVAITFVIGAVLAAVAGVMVTLYYGVVDFYIGFVAGIKAFTAAVLGGIGNLRGALVGGIVLGLIENWGAAIWSSEWKDVIAFTVLVVVLMFRPTGLLGESLAKARA